jgi:hypothetical protein
MILEPHPNRSDVLILCRFQKLRLALCPLGGATTLHWHISNVHICRRAKIYLERQNLRNINT